MTAAITAPAPTMRRCGCGEWLPHATGRDCGPRSWVDPGGPDVGLAADDWQLDEAGRADQ